jgi:hypothetical protein
VPGSLESLNINGGGNMSPKGNWIQTAVIFVAIAALAMPALAVKGYGDPKILRKMHKINAELEEMGLGIAINEIELYTIGNGRPSNRIHQSGSRWVSGDPNRLAQGNDITYIVDQALGATFSGVSAAVTEAAIDSSLTTWDNSKCMGKVSLVKRADDGLDHTIYDAFFGAGGFGNPFAADIVNAGWFPPAFFLAVTGSPNVLAFSVSFIFIDGAGNPFDGNGDNYPDRALNEVYYNDGFNWGINTPIPQVDVETVALHENGHSLGIGHFGPPPAAVMNPIYAGINQSPDAIDKAGMCTLWRRWPR